MNIACSTCLGSLTSRSDVSTIPCGHVFHTNCIEKWVQNGHSCCSQCRKDFRNGEIIKLYFSESQSENDLVNELEEAKLEANEKLLKFQKENLEYQKENLKLQEENTSLREENLGLSRHVNDLTSNSSNIGNTLKRKSDEFAKEAKKCHLELLQH